MVRTARWVCLALFLTLSVLVIQATAQETGSATRNLRKASHTTGRQLAALGELSSLTFDQSPIRPYLYVGGHSGWTVMDVSDPGAPRLMPALPTNGAVSDLAHFQVGGKTYVAVASTPRIEIFDVTASSGSKAPERVGSCPGSGATHVFAYRHSNGTTLLIVTDGDDALLYDAAELVRDRRRVVATIPTPAQLDPDSRGYDGAYAAYHAATESDRFYGAGAGGYHIYDITRPDSAVYLTSATPASDRRGRMVSVTPDGRYLLAGAEYRAAPLRIFDLMPAYEGRLPVIKTSSGAWTDDWRSFLLEHELRWPLVFVASGEQGMQIFDMRDPEAPYTYAYLRTSAASLGSIDDRVADVQGAVDVDVRNSDGLIAVVDRQTGVWLARLEAFQGWDGRGYGLPNISSVQNWADGPNGATNF